METNQLWEYVVETPTGWMCKLCSKQYGNVNAFSILWHLAKIKCPDVGHCLRVPVDVQNRLRQGLLQHKRKRDSVSTDHCLLPCRKQTPLSTVGVHLPTSHIVGKQFVDYVKYILCCLMDGRPFRIGIHGVGGVGKTQVAKYINNKLLQRPNKFYHVFWVNMSPDWSSSWNRTTVSPPCSVRSLQSSIALASGVKLWGGDDESNRAAQLTKGLAEKKKSLLILDDVWDYIPLEEVGIPVGVDGCTVLFTTRSLEVCRQLGCQRNIEMKCLPPDESYELFKKKLGKETTLGREVEEISRLVLDKCAGLPLAITIRARQMKGVTDKHKWRSALRGKMRKKADMEIFQILKISYDYLKDPTLQRCFLYCASLVEENRRKLRLAEYLVDEGIIKNMNSRTEELDEAFTMLDFLRDVLCLIVFSIRFCLFSLFSLIIPNFK